MSELGDCGGYHFISFGQALSSAVDTAALARDIANDTESPIEALFGIAAARELSKEHRLAIPQFVFSRARKEDIVKVDFERVLMIPQYWWHNYRIDWAFHANFLKNPWVFVECDGRDFHSSDDQIMRDAKRDAAARAAGIRVLRFSGSDIHRNAMVCAMAVLWEIDAQYWRERGR